MYAVIRTRGTLNVEKRRKENLNFLRLRKPNHCVIVPETGIYKGMLQKSKDYITWGEISDNILEKMIVKRGKITQKKKADEKDSKKICKLIKDGKDPKIKPVFQLSPPKKGFERKGIKKTFKQGGVLGYRGKKINDLLEKMI